MDFDKNIADKYLGEDVRWIINRKDNGDTFFDLFKGIWNGEILTEDLGKLGFVKNTIGQSEPIKIALQNARGSYSLSAILSEKMFVFSSGTDQFLDALKQLEDLDYSDTQERNEAEKEIGNLLGLCEKVKQKEDEILEEVEDYNVVAKLFSLDGNDSSSDLDGIDPFLALKDNAWIKKIADICGRLVQIYTHIKRTAPGRNKLVPSGYYRDNDIPNILPDQFLFLFEEEYEYLFLKDFAERNLLCQDFTSKEEQGKGPIYIFVDNSSSMSEYDKLSWAYGVAASIIFTAKEEKQNRKIRLCIFNHRYNWYDITDKSIIDVFNIFAKNGAQGATDFEPPLKQFLRDYEIESSSNKRGDIILITDGLLSLSPEIMGEFNTVRYTTNLHMFSVFIGQCESKQISEMSDMSMTILDLMEMAEGKKSKLNSNVMGNINAIHTSI